MKRKSLTRATLAMILGLSIATPALASEYTVQSNDTLWKISQQQNIPLNTVIKENPNVDPANLQIGQTIRLPQLNNYVVSENETFWTISRKLRIPLNELLKANPGIDPLNLYAGIKLKLPGAANATYRMEQASSQPSSAEQKPSYSKVVSAVASAYSGVPEENGGWGGLDYFGNELKVGTIAVDPSVIPLGSKVYITGYSFPGLPEQGMIAHATDVGGAIKGDRVDIYVPGQPDHVSNFGLQNVKIYVLN